MYALQKFAPTPTVSSDQKRFAKLVQNYAGAYCAKVIHKTLMHTAVYQIIF